MATANGDIQSISAVSVSASATGEASAGGNNTEIDILAGSVTATGEASTSGLIQPTNIISPEAYAHIIANASGDLTEVSIIVPYIYASGPVSNIYVSPITGTAGGEAAGIGSIPPISAIAVSGNSFITVVASAIIPSIRVIACTSSAGSSKIGYAHGVIA